MLAPVLDAFCRHKSGPVYLWYEIISPRYLRQHTDTRVKEGVDDEDVVIDSQEELLWRLRALCGLKNTLGFRILAVGGPGGWAQPKGVVPQLVKEKWKFDIRTVTYDELGQLAVSFNSMMKALRNSRAELQDWGYKLEQKVEEATHDLHRAQAEAARGEKLASVGLMAAGIAHELNNPLTGVLTFATLVRKEMPPGSPEAEDLDLVIQETRRCATIASSEVATM